MPDCRVERDQQITLRGGARWLGNSPTKDQCQVVGSANLDGSGPGTMVVAAGF